AFVTLFFLNIFMLAFGGRVVQAALREATPARRERYQRILSKIYDSMGGYIAGLLLIASVNTCCTTIFLAINKVPFFLPLGIPSGLLSFIPYVGPAVMAISTSIISLVTGGVWHAVASGVYFILYGQFEGQVLSPIVYRRAGELNPLIALLSVVFFLDLAGPLGGGRGRPVPADPPIPPCAGSLPPRGGPRRRRSERRWASSRRKAPPPWLRANRPNEPPPRVREGPRLASWAPARYTARFSRIEEGHDWCGCDESDGGERKVERIRRSL